MAAAAVAYVLPALEPVLGISIAINLAYLNLPKFQYITLVRECLKKRLEKLDGRVAASVGDTRWYKQLSALANVETLDLAWPKLTKPWWIDAPGFWGALYNVFFYWRLGRIFSFVATAYAIILLILGVGYSSGAMTAGGAYFNATIGRHFFWASASALWPILTVIAGEFVCVSAVRFLNYQTESLQEKARTDAEKVLGETAEALEGVGTGEGAQYE